MLDPCCGTGSYVVEVLRRIRRTLAEQGLGDLVGERLQQGAMTRVAGFEIMTAPFIIAHWQVGEELRRAGAPLAQGERAAIFLTNALTGWDPAEETGSLEAAFEALARERIAATNVKQNQPILVVLGNPPYNAFAGTSPASEGGLVEPYKQGLQDRWGVRFVHTFLPGGGTTRRRANGPGHRLLHQQLFLAVIRFLCGHAAIAGTQL